MLMPSIFGESLFDDFDNLMNFSFPDVDKTFNTVIDPAQIAEVALGYQE